MAEVYLVVLKTPFKGYDINNPVIRGEYTLLILNTPPVATTDANLLALEGVSDPFIEVLALDYDGGGIDFKVTFNRSDIRAVIWVKDNSQPIAAIAAALAQPANILDLSAVVPPP
jgi:hypothetical protein